MHLHLIHSPSDAAPARGDAITVVLADDHPLVLRSLRAALEHEDRVEVVAQAADRDAVARCLRVHAPRVLVLDPYMAGGSGFAAIRDLRRRAPDTQIVILTMEHSPAFARRALEMGAAGCVLKERADTDLGVAIRRAAAGESRDPLRHHVAGA